MAAAALISGGHCALSELPFNQVKDKVGWQWFIVSFPSSFGGQLVDG
jgi:hypothetical protein